MYSEETKKKKREWMRQYREANPGKAAESARQYRERNPEKAREADRRFKEANREKIAERYRQYVQANREKVLAARRRYREANREKLAEEKRQYNEANRERDAERFRRYREANPEIFSAIRKRRRARVFAAKGSHTEAEWQALCSYYMDQCLCCGDVPDSLTEDHIVPLAKGGSDDISNIQPLCLICNSRKGVKVIDYRLDFDGGIAIVAESVDDVEAIINN